MNQGYATEGMIKTTANSAKLQVAEDQCGPIQSEIKMLKNQIDCIRLTINSLRSKLYPVLSSREDEPCDPNKKPQHGYSCEMEANLWNIRETAAEIDDELNAIFSAICI